MKEALSNFIIDTLKENLVVLYAQIHQGGVRVAEYQRLDSKSRLNVWSLAKGFVSCAAGIALDEGLIALDEKISDIFPEYMPADPGPFNPEAGSFRSEGRLGQFCLAYPEQDTVITIMSIERNFYRIGHFIWQDIIPRLMSK